MKINFHSSEDDNESLSLEVQPKNRFFHDIFDFKNKFTLYLVKHANFGASFVLSIVVAYLLSTISFARK